MTSFTKASHSIFEFVNGKVLKGLFQLNVFTNFRSYVKKYFTNPKLTRLMEFPILFLGATPQNTPALYSLMNYSGLYQGTYYPMGGFHEIILGLSKLAKEKGVKFKFSSIVEKINITSEKVNDIIVDPGFGFSKDIDQNYSLLKNLDLLKSLDLPILVGLSRKSMIYKLLETTPEYALNGSTTLNTVALLNGASILRVHDVKEAMECIKITNQFNKQ